MVCRQTPHSLATSPTVRPLAITARTALYLCSVTLISLMARECRVGTEVAVANVPKVCRAAAEGVLSPSSRTYTGEMAPGPRFEPEPCGLTDRFARFRNCTHIAGWA